MPACRTLALVIRSVEVFESSLVVTLFTRELGKASALAKGARRLKSPFQGGLDLLSVSDIVLLPRASDALDLLTESAPEERFGAPRQSLQALYAGFHIAELLSELLDHHDPHPRLFDAARITLRRLGDPGERGRRLARFELFFLRELGLAPTLNACAQCGRDLEIVGDRVAFGLASCGVLCHECRPGVAHVVLITPAELEAVRVLSSPGDGWRSLDESSAPSQGACRTVGLVLSHVLGKRPRFRPLVGV